MHQKRRTVALWLTFALGIGLIAAPAVFQMFTRAPAGGEMIDDFAAYMTQGEISQFRRYMDVIGAADDQSIGALRADLDRWGTLTPAEVDAELAAMARLNETWPAIDADMSDLLDRMEANLDNYDAVAALPPFALFPWFFVAPGVLIAGLAGYSLFAIRHDRPVRLQIGAMAALGVAVALAPVAFQMFSRAPQGAEMIDDFRPMMTRERVLDVQGYFVTMGAAEGQLRTDALPLAAEAGGIDVNVRYPAITEFSDDWPTIVGDFSPMVATMSDNVDNFEGIDALPPFDLFPWFFVAPGLLVAVMAQVARRSGGTDDAPVPVAIPRSQPSMSRSS